MTAADVRRLLGIVMMAMAAACTPALNWREVPLEFSGAEALLPCKPDRTSTQVPLGGVPTELAMAGCKAGGATFALMTALAPAGTTPDEILRGWEQATLDHMHATEVERAPFVPRGGLALQHAQRLSAHGVDAGGAAIAAQAVWTAHALPGGKTELLHAIIYAPGPEREAADAFFDAIRWSR